MDYFSTKHQESYVEESESLVAGDVTVPVENVSGFSVPIFSRQSQGINEFSIIDAAEIHDNAMNWLHQTHGTSEEWLRNKLVSEIPQVASQNPRILVTSCGAGNDLAYLLARFPTGIFYVQDIAYEMLESAISRNIEILSPLQFYFSVSDACDLPFDDEVFDIVYHFGGVNLFPDVKKGIEEMHRVAKADGAVLFGDEGIAAFLYNDEIAEVLIKNNPLYQCECPHAFIPPFVAQFKLQYLFNNCFYLVTYIKKTAHSIDIDVSHIGRRGGSLRTRYFGQLEGVSPELTKRVYEKASELGLSRVDFLEELLARGLSDG